MKDFLNQEDFCTRFPIIISQITLILELEGIFRIEEYKNFCSRYIFYFFKSQLQNFTFTQGTKNKGVKVGNPIFSDLVWISPRLEKSLEVLGNYLGFLKLLKVLNKMSYNSRNSTREKIFLQYFEKMEKI